MARLENIAFAKSLTRVATVAQGTLIEAVRLRLTLLMVAVGLALVGMVLWLRTFNFGRAELKFIVDFGFGVTGLLSTLLGALAMAHLTFRDLEGGLAAVVLTRRVTRQEYFAGKAAGVALLLALFVSALGLVLAGLVALRAGQLGAIGISWGLFASACAVVWLKATLVVAMTLFVCSYAGSELFAACAGLMLAVVAHLRPFTEATGWLAWMRLWPNLGVFDVEAVFAGAGPVGGGFIGLAAYWALFVGVFTGLGAYVFKHREI